MPPPGTLKRRPVEENEIASLLEEQFKIRPLESRTYVRLLTGHDMTEHEISVSLGISLEQTEALMDSMTSSGLVIRAAGSECRYSPLHPRMTMTNIFKMYEKEIVIALREHRATVDRIVNLLTPIYEDRKSASAERA
ncbi:MAG TPA: helix-turn-helix domain-containing protein [Candidatus Dormibacteraeota bacterium]|jgi:sugar-specific transcriptional regulator TrmB|nr:helix-turn-helix domain-containing protein [Candidatus Dormibacteraeota bacterium]